MDYGKLTPKTAAEPAHPPAKNKENSASHFTNVPGAYVVAAVLPKLEKIQEGHLLHSYCNPCNY